MRKSAAELPVRMLSTREYAVLGKLSSLILVDRAEAVGADYTPNAQV